MEKTPLQKYWLNNAIKFNLDLEIPYILKLQSGVEITIEVLIKNFGNKNGMLVISSYSAVKDHIDEIINNDYGYSCMSQPSDKELILSEGIEDLLNDWGRCY